MARRVLTELRESYEVVKSNKHTVLFFKSLKQVKQIFTPEYVYYNVCARVKVRAVTPTRLKVETQNNVFNAGRDDLDLVRSYYAAEGVSGVYLISDGQLKAFSLLSFPTTQLGSNFEYPVNVDIFCAISRLNLGSVLLGAIEDHLRDDGNDYVLRLSPSPGAVNFYERCGFRRADWGRNIMQKVVSYRKVPDPRLLQLQETSRKLTTGDYSFNKRLIPRALGALKKFCRSVLGGKRSDAEVAKILAFTMNAKTALPKGGQDTVDRGCSKRPTNVVQLSLLSAVPREAGLSVLPSFLPLEYKTVPSSREGRRYSVLYFFTRVVALTEKSEEVDRVVELLTAGEDFTALVSCLPAKYDSTRLETQFRLLARMLRSFSISGNVKRQVEFDLGQQIRETARMPQSRSHFTHGLNKLTKLKLSGLVARVTSLVLGLICEFGSVPADGTQEYELLGHVMNANCNSWEIRLFGALPYKYHGAQHKAVSIAGLRTTEDTSVAEHDPRTVLLRDWSPFGTATDRDPHRHVEGRHSVLVFLIRFALMLDDDGGGGRATRDKTTARKPSLNSSRARRIKDSRRRP